MVSRVKFEELPSPSRVTLPKEKDGIQKENSLNFWDMQEDLYTSWKLRY